MPFTPEIHQQSAGNARLDEQRALQMEEVVCRPAAFIFFCEEAKAPSLVSYAEGHPMSALCSPHDGTYLFRIDHGKSSFSSKMDQNEDRTWVWLFRANGAARLLPGANKFWISHKLDEPCILEKTVQDLLMKSSENNDSS
jgi:hypothetical protein